MSLSPAVALIVSLPAALLLALVLLATGARLRQWGRLPAPPGLVAPIDFLLGAWLLSLLAEVLGLCGLFTGTALAVVVAVLAANGRWRGAGWRVAPLVPPALGLVVLLPVALARPFFYDALVYHLGLPWQALVEGRLSRHPEDLFSAFPPLVQMLYALPVAAGLDRVPALLHLAAFVMAGAAIGALARRLGAPLPFAAGASALLPLLPAIVLVGALPAAEGFLLAAVPAAIALALATGHRGRAAVGCAIAVGCLAGIGTAARLQGISWSLILVALLALSPRLRLKRILGALAGFFAGSASWWMKNLVLLHEPFAPIGWRRTGIETLWRDSGAQIFTSPGADHFVAAAFHVLQPHLSYVLPLVLAALYAAIAADRRRPILATLSACGLGIAAWAATGTLPRFLGPALAIFLALAAAAARTPVGRFVGGLALAGVALFGLIYTAKEVQLLGGVALLQSESASALNPLIVNDPLPTFDAAAALPRDSRALFVAEARSYRFPRRATVPSQHDLSLLGYLIERSSDAAAARTALLKAGYTHLVINRAEMVRLAADYPVVPWTTPAGQARFQALIDLCGAPVVKVGETAVLALR